MSPAELATLDGLVDQIAAASWKERDRLKEALMAAASAVEDRVKVLDHLEERARVLPLEARWEVDEVVDALRPPPAEAPPPKEEPKKKGLSQSDLVLVYDDPRGLALHRTKVAPERWFVTQLDPRTGQPMTAEVPAAQVPAIKAQLQGSPYWVLGSGGAGGAAPAGGAPPRGTP